MSSSLTDNSTANPMSQSAPAGQNGPMDVEAARRVEDSKLTRRAALRKLGYGAGIAAFSLLGVDDFARMVGQRMGRMAGDSQVAQAVAQEFRQAGITLANPAGPQGSQSCATCEQHYQDCIVCGCNVNHAAGSSGLQKCYNAQAAVLNACCPSGTAPVPAICSGFNANYCAS